MKEWEAKNKGKCFISDIGESKSVAMAGCKSLLGRYAVWMPDEENGHQVVEMSDNIEQLMRKYEVPQERVYVVTI